ncbi:MAG TPA: dihydrolipoamide acetyltransferase family protein [Actinomycetes bacterium]|jgi:pyruvate dehydrogenase E2 component (dihydrolipoamide acetyltransferase)|nr:dihydrolipoamide acetyltransferase family protein [Actinomycetes bacterium]
MITEVRMPKLGMAMKKGAVTKWLKAEGEAVQEGADLFELATEKITAVVPAPASGVLGRVVADKGAELPVGALLALIGEPGDTFPPKEELAAWAPAAAPAAAPTASAAAAGAVAAPASGEPAPASPAARRRARELGVDIALVPPGAPGKRIMVEDVEAFAAAAEAQPAPAGRVVPFVGIRKVVAERLTESLQTMAQVTVAREVDAGGLVARRAALAAGFEAATGVRLTYTDLLVEIVARLLRDHPLLNATLTDQGIVCPDAVHMGVAVALEDGLIVPVVRDAGSRSLAEIARERADLAAKAQAGTLSLDEVEGGTFTISNLGSFGADAFTPIVNPPQCAILGVGRIVDKPVAVAGRVEVRPMGWLSLTFDHRIVDGAPAARFLQELGDRVGTSG